MSLGTLLAVDDTPENLVLLVGILERAGYEVRAVNSAARALRLLEREIPELILLDIEMPDVDGIDLCRQIKARGPALAAVPVLFVTAMHDLDHRLRGFEAGGVDYVTKPFEEAEVLARVATQLRVHRLQRDLERRNAELLAAQERLLREQQRTAEVFSTVATLLPGRLLDDAYRVETLIGSGGFGSVYRGTDLRLDRAVAIKVLRPMGRESEALARFRREGIASCRVRHASAVEVFAAGYWQGVPYLVMELLDGETLAARLGRERKLPPREAAAIAGPVAAALDAAHAARVVHRDVKPDNVFLHRSPAGPVVKVLDFGIARLLDDEDGAPVTRTGHLVGTPEYMAPEQLMGEAPDASADVYALGVVLFRMLTGEQVFEQQERFDLAETVLLHLTSRPRDLASLAPGLDAGLAALVGRMLARRPSTRPSAREVADQLAAFE